MTYALTDTHGDSEWRREAVVGCGELVWVTVVGRMRLLRSLFFQTATPASCTADVSPNEWNMISSIDWPYPSSSVPMRPSATFSLPVHRQRHAPRGKRRPP